MMHSVYIGTSAFIIVACVFLITCRNYDDGVVGRAALMLLALIHATIVADWWNGTHYEPLRQTVWGNIAVALLLFWKIEVHWRKHYREIRKQRGSTMPQSMSDTFRGFIGAKRK